MELIFQPLLGMGVFRRHHQPRGALVQPVDRVETRLIPGYFVMIHQKITQSIVKMAVTRVDQHPGGLVDHNEVLVLVHDVQRTFHRNDAREPGRSPAKRVRQAHRQGLPRLRPDPDVHPDPVQGDAVVQPLHPAQDGARQPQMPPQERVHLQPRQLRGDCYGEIPGAHSVLDR